MSRSFAGVTIALIASLLLLVDAGEEVVLLVVPATAVVLRVVVSSFHLFYSLDRHYQNLGQNMQKYHYH